MEAIFLPAHPIASPAMTMARPPASWAARVAGPSRSWRSWASELQHMPILVICVMLFLYICICICICHICHYMSISSELERCTRLMLKSLAFCFVYKQRINTAGFVSLKLLTWSICKPLLHCSKSHTFSCLERSCLHFENSEQGLADMTVGFY